MTQRSGTPQARTAAAGRDWWPAAAAGLALIVVMAGIRGPAPRIALSGPASGQLRVAGGVLEAVLAVLLAALLVAGRRPGAAGQPAARLRGWLRGLLLLGLVVIPVLMLLSIHIKTRPRPQPSASPPPSARGRPSAPPLHDGTFIRIEVIVIDALAAAAVLAAAIAAARALWRYWPRRAQVPAAGPQPPPGTDAADLSRAVDSGQAALRRFGEARAAIIACYVAMEQSLARAGAARAEAETPDELLARAAADGLVRGRAASRLTLLFYHARFSSHPVPPARKEAAEEALAELAAELSFRAETASGNLPGHSGAPPRAPQGQSGPGGAG